MNKQRKQELAETIDELIERWEEVPYQPNSSGYFQAIRQEISKLKMLLLLIVAGHDERKSSLQGVDKQGLLSPALTQLCDDAEAMQYAAVLCELSEEAFEAAVTIEINTCRRWLTLSSSFGTSFPIA